MACKVTYLSSAGIQKREVKGLDALAKSFPSSWLVYASLNAFPKNGPPIEIDVLVVMDDRIVLLELKDWNGPLTTKGDVWVHGRRRQRSPVALGAEKARKVKGIVVGQIPSLRGVFVDSRVVLTATSTRDQLPQDEQRYVLTLEEAQRLGDRKERSKLLGPVTLSRVQPNMLVKDFEKLFGGGSYFQPLKMTWDGYGVTDEDFFVHRGDIWREHRAELKREERVKALLRLWRFDQLPVGLNEPDGRQLIADRELKTAAFLGEQGSWMAEGGILKQVGTSPDEVLTEHHQLVAIPSGWTTLRRYLERLGPEMAGEHRIDIMHKLASMVAELHARGVSHRDIGGDAVWLGSPTSMSLTGFFSATLPDETSVADYLDVLGTYAEPEPDWGGAIPTARERDVRGLGLLMRDISADAEDGALPPGWNEVMDKALAPPGERHLDARAMADALGQLRTPSGPTVDQSRLDAFETTDIPYVAFPPAGAMHNGRHSTRYESAGAAGRLGVKVWNGLQRGDARRDHALLAMLEGAGSIRAVPLEGAPDVIAVGLSKVGPFLVTRWVEGSTLDEYATSTLAETLGLFEALLKAVETLHLRDLAHGDLHPDNVLVGEGGGVTLLDLFDVSPVGAGRVRSAAWAPADHERRSDQQIDRFATCRMIALRAESASGPEMDRIAAAARAELDRVAIETLAPLAEAVALERRRLLSSAPSEFTLTAPTFATGTVRTDAGHLWVKAFRTAAGQDVFWVTGLDRRVLIRLRDGQLEHLDASEPKLSDLGQGEHVPLLLTLAQGPEAGAVELAEHLRGFVTPDEYRVTEVIEDVPDWEGEDAPADDPEDPERDADGPVLTSPAPLRAFNVARMWLRSSEIEEETVLQIRLDRRLADVASAAIYEYATPQPLEFEDDDTVEVRLGGVQGRMVGLLDVPRCDDRQVAIRDQRFPISAGEFVSLVDRRDRVSKERRRRAVERMTRRASVIPALIDYFDPGIDAPDIPYEIGVSDEALGRYGLNAGQRSAFRALLGTGPVGMLQGPPGSGKTRFIAAFAHWLLTEGGVRRILIASQSHEAVNNVLEELLKTFRKHGGQADMLRVGSRGATERVRPYQARSLRESYRVRFENGLKTRMTHAAGAAGIPRAMVHEVVDVDQRLGRLHRSMVLAAAAEANDGGDVAPRTSARIRSLVRAFSREASSMLGREVEADPASAAAIVEEALAAVLARYPKASPGDMVTARRLLALANEWQEALATGRRNFDEFLAKTRRVVAGTCVGLGQSQIRLDEGVFDWVIVDEAARCTSGELAVPLQLGSRVALVGDQLQLRPMVDRAVQQGLRREFKGLGRVLAKSDFERAFDSPYGRRNALVLDEQYRMAPAISDLVSTIFYAPHGVELKPSPDRIPDAAFAGLPADLARPLAWFDTSALPDAEEKSRDSGRAIWNDAEIATVLSLLERIALETDLVDELARRNEPAIGVICMYSEQKRRIEREWSQRPFAESFRRLVTIDTVDAYQGKENAIVIVTLVRSNDDMVVGHVGRENRCNVAVSRAKERLYIVGDADMWASPHCISPMRQVLHRIRGSKDHGVVTPAGSVGK